MCWCFAALLHTKQEYGSFIAEMVAKEMEMGMERERDGGMGWGWV